MRTTAVVVACLLAAGLTTGCSSGNQEEPATARASDTESASPTKSFTPSPSPDRFKLGDTANRAADGLKWTAAALSFKDSGISSSPGLLDDGQKWAMVEIKVCNTGGPALSTSPFTWTLAYADGSRVEATHVSGGVTPGPLYPQDTKLKGGDCVRGKVTFQVPLKGRAARVMYSPSDLDEPMEWAVPKP
ncbi:DUF4352 domain-containing protein [Streptomyces sp. NPDC002698]|uniref:DUF4352 domain-containing protein n=1 Tax=Streptomyces sp. NPDC002698 TaxID=3364660 RepID=UPI003691407A